MTTQSNKKPLTTWTCDTCGEDITNTGQGVVVWRHDNAYRGYDFRIVHKDLNGEFQCDPGKEAGFVQNLDLFAFLGADGQARLLALLSAGPVMDSSEVRVADFDSWVDLFRRVQTPWYEEARVHWDSDHTQHWLSDATQAYPYTPDVLERIAGQRLGFAGRSQ
jgi:hypothetical protein